MTVFAGLGSPAAVLTETLSRVRTSVPDALRAYVVDPASSTPFTEALDLPADAHIRRTWGSFMAELVERVLIEQLDELAALAEELCQLNGWGDEHTRMADLGRQLLEIGLVGFGKARSAWFLKVGGYIPLAGTAPLIADLLLAACLLESAGYELHVRTDGWIDAVEGGDVSYRVRLVSGAGVKRWAALEPELDRALKSSSLSLRPVVALVCGVVGVREALSPPDDLVGTDDPDDILAPSAEPIVITPDDLRANEHLLSSKLV